jgi:glycosyltransferase involved in cell wall biosynthesis
MSSVYRLSTAETSCAASDLPFSGGPKLPKHLVFVMGCIGIHGPTLIRFSLIEELLSRDMKISIVIPKWASQLDLNIPLGCQVIRIESNSVLGFSYKLRKYLQKDSVDGVIANSWPYTAAAILACTTIPSKIPVVVSEHVDFRSNFNISGEFTNKDKFLLRSIARFIYNRANKVVGVSHGVVAGLSEVVGIKSEKMQVIYNPLRRLDLFEQPDCELFSRVDSFWSDSQLRLLAVGRLAPQKDYPTMIKALAIIRKRLDSKNAKLVIAGPGFPSVELKNLIADLGLVDSIFLTGNVIRLDLLYNRAEVFLMSSTSEGFGNVLVEALSYGLSIVTTDCPSGPSEILAAGKYGSLVPIGDPDQFANAVIASLSTKLNKEDLISRSSVFDVKDIADQYLSALN